MSALWHVLPKDYSRAMSTDFFKETNSTNRRDAYLGGVVSDLRDLFGEGNASRSSNVFLFSVCGRSDERQGGVRDSS